MPLPSARLIAHNLRRVMAQAAMTYDDVVATTGLDSRTVRGIAHGDHQPRAKTLNKLAEGLGVEVDELFTPPVGLSEQQFDAATNPMIEGVRERLPDLFANWSSDDFAELASRFGIGGELTEPGVLAEAESMNSKRSVLTRAKVVLETPQGRLLSEFIDVLYERVTIDR